MSKTFVLFLSLFFSINSYVAPHLKCAQPHTPELSESFSADALLAEEGFIAGTLIKTPIGYTAIEHLSEGDVIIGCDPVNGDQPKMVLGVSKKKIPAYVVVFSGNETIIAAPGQKFYLPRQNTWVGAKDIAPAHDVHNCYVECVDEIHMPIYCYTLSVEGHTFYITPHDILVHNAHAFAYEAEVHYVIWAIQLGQIIINHPLATVYGSAAIGLIHMYMNLPQKNPINHSVQESPSVIPERFAYEKVHGELIKMRDDFLKIKKDLELLTKQVGQTNLTEFLLYRIQLPTHPLLDRQLNVSITQELQYNEGQKANLTKLRELEIDQLEQHIVSTQIALAIHFDELVSARNVALDEYLKHASVITTSIGQWKSNAQNIPLTFVMCFYANLCIQEWLISNLESRTQELMLAIQYYKNAGNASILKKTSNIIELVDQEEKLIASKNSLVSDSKKINAQYQNVVGRYLVDHKIDIQKAKHTTNSAKQKEREAGVVKCLADAEIRRGSAKFPEGPKKDDDDKDKNPSNKLPSVAYERINMLPSCSDKNYIDAVGKKIMHHEKRYYDIAASHVIGHDIHVDTLANGSVNKILGGGHRFYPECIAEELGVTYEVIAKDSQYGALKGYTWFEGEKYSKTWFPAHWSEKMIMEKIKEALNGAERTIKETKTQLTIWGRTKEGFPVKAFYDKAKDIITTAFPDGEILFPPTARK